MNTQKAIAPDFDVAIIGGGPCGVAASISIKTEGPSVVILDEKGPGGQVVTSSKIENVFGVPVGGLSGIDLMGRGVDQAQAFGVQFRSPFRAVRLMQDEPSGLICIVAANRERLLVRAVVLAIGASYRRLDAQGIEQFSGRGVVYGSPQYQVPKQWEGKKVGIIGGGNSAGQASLFLSQCADCEVSVFVRGAGLENDMSEYLIKRFNEARNITVHPYTKLAQVRGNDQWMSEIVVNKKDDGLRVLPLDYLLVQIGAEPQTGWLEDYVVLDQKGYILTDRDIPKERWRGGAREPFRYEAAPGVFVGGDVHHGSPNRMSCAVGEGHALAVSVYQYLTLLQRKSEDKPVLKAVS